MSTSTTAILFSILFSDNARERFKEGKKLSGSASAVISVMCLLISIIEAFK